MFTGIIETVGEVSELSARTLSIASTLEDLVLGESVCVQGVCLTVTWSGRGLFSADLSEETISRTTLGHLEENSKVNLERAVRADGRFGGHVVQGHVDGTGTVTSVRALAGSTEISFQLPRTLLRYLTSKGSVAIDGVSLTVSALSEEGFDVSLIPKTLEETTLGELREGTHVNVEVDILAKYVERLLGKDG